MSFFGGKKRRKMVGGWRVGKGREMGGKEDVGSEWGRRIARVAGRARDGGRVKEVGKEKKDRGIGY